MKFNKLLILGFLLIALVALPVSFAADISVTDLNPNDVSGTDLSLKEVNQSISSTSTEEEVSSFDTSNLLDNETVYLNGSYTGSVEKGTLKNPYKNINNATNALLNSNKTNLFIANGNYIINNHFDVDSKNINIIGESASGVTINCNEDYLFAFTNSNSNIYNLIITNGYSNSDYALIWTELSNITLCNVVFTNNLVNSPGGIILTIGGTFKLINSSIKNNLIDYGDGGISGGIIYSECNLIIVNSSFVNNTIKSSTYNGGAIFVNGNLEFINSTISELCVVSDELITGAFIHYSQSNNGDCAHIINSSFEKSKFEYVSGLIFTDARNCIINNVNISDNYARSLQGNISVLDIYYTSYIENLNIFNNTYDNVSISLSSVMNFLYRNGYFNISEQLPDKYDLRDYDLTTIAKNQGSSGSCWAFATIGALESYLLKYWNESFDLSENNMKNIMKKYGINGSEWDPNKDGGNDVLALAYLLRWSGAVNESDDPYNQYSNHSDLYDAVCHVQDVIYIPLRLNYTDNDQIKYAILKYGAVWTEMHATGVIGLNVYSTESLDSDHAVAIVGWNDNYSASNFDIRPPGDGAFIVKNSWGPNWGDNGYFYVSYYDASFAGFASNSKFSGYVFANVEKTYNYDSIYYYDPFGNDFVAGGYLSNTAWFANQFRANDKEILSAFGIYTYGDSNYTANIYVNDELIYTQEGIIYNSGYHTIRLNKQLGLNKGDIFKIEVKLTTPNCLYPIALEVYHEGFVNATANPNESFVSVDGVTWDDLTDLIENANVCIKAYTVNPNYVIEVNETEIEAYVEDVITLKVIVKDLSGITKDLSSGNISVIFPDSTVVIPAVSGDEISFTIPNTNVSGILVIKFETSDYLTIFANLNLSIIKHISHLVVSFNESIYVRDNCSFIINVSDENNNPICEGVVAIYENGVNVANLTITNGTVIWNYSYNSAGVYNINIVYAENNKYTKSSINRTIVVNKLGTNLYLDSFNSHVLSSVTLIATVESTYSVNGTVTFYVGDSKVATVNVVNGVAKYNYNCKSAGIFNIKAIFNENAVFNSSQNTSNLTVNKIPVKMTIKQNNTYYKSAFITITLNKPINGQEITLKFSNGKTATVSTNSKGVATYYIPFATGSYSVTGSLISDVYCSDGDYLPFKINKATATITPYKLSTTYCSGDYFKVKVTDNKGKIMVGVKLTLKVYTGSKYKKVTVTTGSDGYAKYSASTLSITKHKVIVSSGESTKYMTAKAKTNYITVSKGKTTVVAPKVTNKCGLNQYFKINVTRTIKKTPINAIALTVKVYKGKKLVKTYSVKTASNGIASINTKDLAAGTYNVRISSSNKYYTVSKSINSGIVIQKQKVVVTAKDTTNIYGKSQYFTITATKVDGGKVISGLAIKVKLYKNGKYVKSYSLKTNKKGAVSFNTKALTTGTYTVKVISGNSKYTVSSSNTGKLIMTKYKTNIIAPNVTNTYKKSQYFKINVTNKDTKKAIKSLSIVVKVYKGSKLVKTYTTSTNTAGTALINTKDLAKGTYKVAISTKNVSYSVSKTIANAIKIK